MTSHLPDITYQWGSFFSFFVYVRAEKEGRGQGAEATVCWGEDESISEDFSAYFRKTLEQLLVIILKKYPVFIN